MFPCLNSAKRPAHRRASIGQRARNQLTTTSSGTAISPTSERDLAQPASDKRSEPTCSPSCWRHRENTGPWPRRGRCGQTTSAAAAHSWRGPRMAGQPSPATAPAAREWGWCRPVAASRELSRSAGPGTAKTARWCAPALAGACPTSRYWHGRRHNQPATRPGRTPCRCSKPPAFRPRAAGPSWRSSAGRERARWRSGTVYWQRVPARKYLHLQFNHFHLKTLSRFE